MKLNPNKNVEITMHHGKISVFVDGKKVMENQAGDNLPYVLGLMVGVLRSKGVIL